VLILGNHLQGQIRAWIGLEEAISISRMLRPSYVWMPYKTNIGGRKSRRATVGRRRGRTVNLFSNVREGKKAERKDEVMVES
jgi:hypothetical protein